MAHSHSLMVRFWGVRSSLPTPAAEVMRYGGNTPCVEVRLATGEIILIDAGSGLRNLGNSLVEEFPGKRLSLRLLLTHFHWDHIQGLPFFSPLFENGHELTIYSAEPKSRVRQYLSAQMSPPFFPVLFESLPSKRQFVQLLQPLSRPGYTLTPFPLNHPQGATGYRIDASGVAVVHASDTEHGAAECDRALLEHSHKADILIYDAQYTPEEYRRRRGWGHSTWLKATRIARKACVKRLVLFNHDPLHSDLQMDEIGRQAAMYFARTLVAREGMVLTV